MYIVTLQNTYSGLRFKFYDFGEAMGFVGQAVEAGEYESVNGEIEKIKVIIEFREV